MFDLVAVSRRNGKLAEVRIARHREFEGRLHLAGPNMWVLSEGQVIDLIDALEWWREEIWGDSGDCERLEARSTPFKAPSCDPETLTDA